MFTDLFDENPKSSIFTDCFDENPKSSMFKDLFAENPKSSIFTDLYHSYITRCFLYNSIHPVFSVPDFDPDQAHSWRCR